jgi:hypothetical protein
VKSDEEIMEILEAYDLTGSCRGAAELAGCSHHTVAHYVAAREEGRLTPGRAQPRPMLIDAFLPKVEEWVDRSRGKIRADVVHERLRALGYAGSERTTRRAVDSEHARRAIGEVAVPFGVCAEPSNIQAGGKACPFRFRCVGCDHFRTDVSYLPDLQAYLDDLLRNRERLLAASGIDEWARSEAMPSEEEISRVRRLIARVTIGLDELNADERERVEQAVALVRRHRTVTLGMPRIRQALPDLRPERTG